MVICFQLPIFFDVVQSAKKFDFLDRIKYICIFTWITAKHIGECKFPNCISVCIFYSTSSYLAFQLLVTWTLWQFLVFFFHSVFKHIFQQICFILVCLLMLLVLFIPTFVAPYIFDIQIRVWALRIWIKRFIKLTSILSTAICSLAQVWVFLWFLFFRCCSCARSSRKRYAIACAKIKTNEKYGKQSNHRWDCLNNKQ